ncbi:tetratricopeptide repeat protein [Micromonospora sp. DT46]|uniref:tetratricopeptide repeat protein n=1 Tax=unclassified Micromonospora TaxID=2617518 RepID=UPI001CECC395|nr:tetratricopeptide repeat protein [Micromonospora sp. AMSO12t]
MSVAALYPSLHLNLGECYRKLGDLGRARECLQRAQAGIGALGDDAYAQLIKGGLDRLAQELTST